MSEWFLGYETIVQNASELVDDIFITEVPKVAIQG